MSNRSWHEPSPLPSSRAEHGDAAVKATLSRILAVPILLLIRAYQLFVSPLLGPACRFHPTCSNYAIEAIARYGPIGGTARALARLARCHPFAEGGFDPVR
ncbi:MAG: membrane protein insertion efficiency factor YidD [Deltaproteobacteria bacterium]|nr:MAG: membrane protein insertion efficiency factor YidD [Deltaproteobacteria bacterium]